MDSLICPKREKKLNRLLDKILAATERQTFKSLDEMFDVAGITKPSERQLVREEMLCRELNLFAKGTP